MKQNCLLTLSRVLPYKWVTSYLEVNFGQKILCIKCLVDVIECNISLKTFFYQYIGPCTIDISFFLNDIRIIRVLTRPHSVINFFLSGLVIFGLKSVV